MLLHDSIAGFIHNCFWCKIIVTRLEAVADFNNFSEFEAMDQNALTYYI